MERYRPAMGTPVEDLDTPVLLIDLDDLEHNLSIIADTYADTQVKMRHHTKNTKSPLLAHMQIRAGGTHGGVCTAKVAEAEVMVEGGIQDILIPNQVVTEDKIDRICSLAQQADVKVAIDDPRNLAKLSEIASRRRATIGVLIEVDTSMGRAGTREVHHSVELARQATELPGIAFRGVMSHQTLPGKPDKETRLIGARKYFQICLDAKSAIEAAGIPVEIVSTGESWSYDIAADIAGVTEVEGGTYMLMSHTYDYMDEFRVAGKVLGTIISTPRPGVAIGDVGSRAMASPGGVLPEVEGIDGATVTALHEEQIVFQLPESSGVSIGDKFQLVNGQQDMLMNRWDQYVAVRNGMVEYVGDIPARGCHN